jgi:hypothetical protein
MPGALEQAQVEFLHQSRDHVDFGAVSVQQRDQPGDLTCGGLEGFNILRANDLLIDLVGLVGQESKQIHGSQNPADLLALGYQHTAHLVLDHRGQRIPNKISGTHTDDGKIGELTDRQPIQRRSMQDGFLQAGSREDAQLWRDGTGVTHQHRVDSQGLKKLDHLQHTGASVDKVRGWMNAASTLAMASDCSSCRLSRSDSALSLLDRSEKSKAPKVALEAIRSLTACLVNW